MRKKIKKQYWESGYVVLKSLNNSQDITFEFLLEIANTKSVDFSLDSSIVPCFGISQDPETKNYIMVMQYVEDGNLREYLRNNYSKLSWKDKLFKLWYIASGLKDIHDQNLIHRDLHSGNILNNSDNEGYLGSYITDLGLSKHVSMFQEEDKVFGVLPYVAPEVLEGKPYTKASDIYSFSIIAYEVLSSLPPYYDQEHNESLGVRICNGLRPAFKIKISSLLEDLINKCWNSDPKQRLGVGELEKKLETDIMKSKVKKTPNWLNKSKKQKNTIKPYPKKLDFPNMKFTKEQFILADQ